MLSTIGFAQRLRNDIQNKIILDSSINGSEIFNKNNGAAGNRGIFIPAQCI